MTIGKGDTRTCTDGDKFVYTYTKIFTDSRTKTYIFTHKDIHMHTKNTHTSTTSRHTLTNEQGNTHKHIYARELKNINIYFSYA